MLRAFHLQELDDMDVSLVIPTYQCDELLEPLLDALNSQATKPREIIVVNTVTGESDDLSIQHDNCKVATIPKEDFTHGRARNQGSQLASGDILVFMTQDCLPADDEFLTNLTQPIREGVAVASYARQMPDQTTPPPEAFTRYHNYPEQSRIRTKADIAVVGIRAMFFSNAASAVRKDILEEMEGFDETVVMNEDMLLCAKMLQAGHAVAYQANARVIHWHDYTLAQQFKRYFSIGVFSRQACDHLCGAKWTGAGWSFAKSQLGYLARNGHGKWIPRTIAELAAKFIGVRLGRHSHMLPRRLRQRLSMFAIKD